MALSCAMVVTNSNWIEGTLMQMYFTPVYAAVHSAILASASLSSDSVPGALLRAPTEFTSFSDSCALLRSDGVWKGCLAVGSFWLLQGALSAYSVSNFIRMITGKPKDDTIKSRPPTASDLDMEDFEDAIYGIIGRCVRSVMLLPLQVVAVTYMTRSANFGYTSMLATYHKIIRGPEGMSVLFTGLPLCLIQGMFSPNAKFLSIFGLLFQAVHVRMIGSIPCEGDIVSEGMSALSTIDAVSEILATQSWTGLFSGLRAHFWSCLSMWPSALLLAIPIFGIAHLIRSSLPKGLARERKQSL